MLERKRILRLFKELDRELAKEGVVGEVLLCGGAVMCLVFQARTATKDVDAAFSPTREVRRAVRAVAERLGESPDWLNDAAKGFFGMDPPADAVLDFPHLRVYAPKADYLLAMKCMAARFDTHDKDDAVFLIRHLGLSRPEEVFRLIEKYYPRREVPAKTRFLVEEILS
ncbi:hypothetical protein EPO15_09775 [bacterium]|nr:MAG: hypothetical protein EPO15_09775 [bacterium]